MALLGNTKAISLTLLDGVIGDLNPKTTNVYNLGTNSLKWANIYATTFNGALTGNAATATKLQTPRTINGTSFDGSANITTANWGTARTLTIGNKGQSVNGSGNVSWALQDVLIRAGNEFNYTADGNASLWFNYKTQTGTSATTAITNYHFGNGQGAITGVTVNAATFKGNLTGNAATATAANITTTANAIAKYSDTQGTFANSNVYIDSNGDVIIGSTDSSGNISGAGNFKIGAKNDSYGIMPYANNWNQIGSSSLYWYKGYINNYYGNVSHVTNWDAGKNIGTAATASAAATRGSVYFYNTCAANGTQTKTLLEANSSTASNITITLPSSTGTLALTSSSITGNAATATAANITTTANAVAYYTNTTGTFGSKASANGALYATSANGALQWGTLPAAQGGTGKTTLKDACNALINALDTGSSNLTANDYVITQYVGGGTTTTTYHRRPASAIRVGGLLTARKLKVALGSTTDVTFDGTADQTSIPVSGTLAITHGGTGLTSSPSMLVNLASVNAANVLQASPRPGVTGILPLGNGGTEASTAKGARANLGLGDAKVYHGNCTTAAGTAQKDVTLDSADFTDTQLVKGVVVFVTFTNTNSATVENLKLKVGTSTAKPLKREYNASTANIAGVGWIRANCTYMFAYDGTNWVNLTDNQNSTYYVEAVYSSTAAATADKLGSSSAYTLQKGYFSFFLVNTNTAANVITLNISSTGAKIVYLNGAITSSSNYNWTKGYYIGYYDGTYYHFRTDGFLPYSSSIHYGTSLPASGAEGQIFYQVSPECYEIPTGGRAGALLQKNSATDRDIGWTSSVYVSGGVLYGAAWNDYAEYRETTTQIESGRVVIENGDDTLSLSTERLQPGAEIVSDTFGFAIGETEKAKTPLAASGRVLAYPNEPRRTYKPGQPVCSGPHGTVSQMTDEEARMYPWLIIGTVSAIPEYDTWGEDNIKVNGRIWIRIR